MKTRERTYAAFEIREGTADRQEAEGVNHCLAAPLFHPFKIVSINLLSETILCSQVSHELKQGKLIECIILPF